LIWAQVARKQNSAAIGPQPIRPFLKAQPSRCHLAL
jgi:hypothetical protein